MIHIPVFSDAPRLMTIGILVVAGIGIALLVMERALTGRARHGGVIAAVCAALMAAWVMLYKAVVAFIDGITHPQPAPRASIPDLLSGLTSGLRTPHPDGVVAFHAQMWMYLAAVGMTILGLLLCWGGLAGVFHRYSGSVRPGMFLTGVALVLASAFTWFVILIPNTV